MAKNFFLILKNKQKSSLNQNKSKENSFFTENINLNKYLLTNRETTFYVKVNDESLTDSDIFPEDLLVVDKSLVPYNNSIVVAAMNNQYVISHYSELKNNKAVLTANKTHDAISVSNNIHLKICGVVTNVIHPISV